MNRTLVTTLIILLVLILTGAGYLIFQNQKLIKQFAAQSPTPTPLSSPQVTPESSVSPSLSPSPSSKHTLLEVQENIEAAINTGNTQAIGTFATDPVSVILQATECCGPKTPDEAVSQLSYVADGVPFNFNQNSDLVKNLKSKNPELSGKFIGLSQNKEHLVAFGLNAQNRITDIRMSVSWKLFSY